MAERVPPNDEDLTALDSTELRRRMSYIRAKRKRDIAERKRLSALSHRLSLDVKLADRTLSDIATVLRSRRQPLTPRLNPNGSIRDYDAGPL